MVDPERLAETGHRSGPYKMTYIWGPARPVWTVRPVQCFVTPCQFRFCTNKQ